MSFRKRNEVVAGSPAAVGRSPRGPAPPRSIPGKIPVQNAAVPGARGPAIPTGTPTGPSGSLTAEQKDVWATNPGVRPSTVTSQPTVSTGCGDLDKVLLHQGLPLQSSLIVEESGTTDFSAVLLRAFAAQGIMHNRVEKNKLRCHVVVVGAPAAWAQDLPGEYKGSSKEQKKAQIAKNTAQVSVANMAENDMKIAWRYGLQGPKNSASEPENSTYEHYLTQFDITQRMVPGASAHEISFVPVGPNCSSVIGQVAQIVQSQAKQGRVVRIVVPALLHPSLYPPPCSVPSYIVPFLHGLRSLVSTNSNAVLMASIALDLYPRDGLITHMAETLLDGVIHLQPFNPDMAALIERAYKNEPAKIQQGLVNIVKVPVLSDRGMMLVANGEYAFKNGRKKFEIDEWGIPVEDTEEEQTTKPIDF